MPDDTPKPGSDEAMRRGCRCPVMDNARGLGWLCSGTFWINDDCPLHADHIGGADEKVGSTT